MTYFYSRFVVIVNKIIIIIDTIIFSQGSIKYSDPDYWQSTEDIIEGLSRNLVGQLELKYICINSISQKDT